MECIVLIATQARIADGVVHRGAVGRGHIAIAIHIQAPVVPRFAVGGIRDALHNLGVGVIDQRHHAELMIGEGVVGEV